MNTSKLNIDRNKLIQEIERLSSTYDIKEEPKDKILTIYHFTLTNVTPATLNIYFNTNGSTTISTKTGKNRTLSKKIASELIAQCSIPEYKSNSFYLKAIRTEDLDVILEILIEQGNLCESDLTDGEGRRKIKLKGKQGETLNITIHTNGAFQAQGKPRLLFSQLIDLLSKLLPFEETINSQLKFYDTNFTSAEIITELENKLVSSHKHINRKVLEMMCPSLAIFKTDMLLPDYSMFAYPAMRGLEGVIKEILVKNGIFVTESEGVSKYFHSREKISVASEELKGKLSCSKTLRALCTLHHIYSKERNGLMHVDSLIETTRTLSKEEAKSLINYTIAAIDSEVNRIYN